MKKLIVLMALVLFAWTIVWAAPEATNTDKEAAAANSPTLETFLQQAAAQMEQAPPAQPYVEEQRQYGKNGEPIYNGQMIMLNGQDNAPVQQGIITSTLLSQNFEATGWSLDNPTPLGVGWAILDSGSEGTNTWWVDDWHKFYPQLSGWYDTAYASCWSTAAYSESLMSEWLITPSFSLATATTCSLYLKEYYDNVSTSRDSANIMISTDGGTAWTRLRTFKADSTTTRTRGLNLATYAGQSNVKIGFWHFIGGTPTIGTNGWIVDSIRVRVNGANLWVQDFSNVCSGWFGNTPPTGPGGAWQVIDNGIVAAPKATNANDWSRVSGLGSYVAGLTYTNTQNRREYQNDWIITPSFSVGAAVACTLSFGEYWSFDTPGSAIWPPYTNSYPEHGYVLVQETTDGGTSWGPWTTLADNNNVTLGSSSTAYNAKISLNDWRNKTVRLGFNKRTNPDAGSSSYWYIDNILVQDYTPVLDNVGTSSLTYPLMAYQGRNWPIKPKVFNNGQNPETFQDSVWIWNVPQGATIVSTGFENGGSRPTGWTDSPGTTYPWAYGNGTLHGPGAPHGGSYAAYFNSYDATYNVTDTLISPNFDLSSLGGVYTLTFWIWHGSSTADSLRVFLDESGTKTLLWRSGGANYSAWTLISVPVTSTSANAKLYFAAISQYGTNIYLDDISLNVFNNTPSTYLRDGITVSSMPALTTQVLTLPSWPSPAPGTYTIKTWTAMVDSIPADSMVTASVTSYSHTGSGGPDAGGYTYKDDITGGGGAYNWIDISSTGTPINFDWGSGDGRYSRGYPLGFNFFYYGQMKNRLFMAEDGYVSFDTMTTYFSTNYAMPYASSQANQISWFWDDLKQSLGRGYFWSNNIDTAIVQFNNWTIYASVDTNTRFDAQIIFSKNDGKIKMQYRKFEPGITLSHTIGIQNAAKTVGLTYVYNGSPMGNLPIPPVAITFAPPMDDIAAAYQLSPTGFMQVGRPYSVQGRFRNNGAVAQTFDVRMVINDGTSNVFDQSQNSLNLNPGDSVTVTFGTFTPASGTGHVFTMTATNPGDENTTNNTLITNLTAYAHEGTGGPDGAGYKWMDNTITGNPKAPVYGWLDTTGATSITFTGGTNDGYSPRIYLGGSMYYYGAMKDTVTVGTDGWISFDYQSSAYYNNTTIPTTAAPNNALFLFWEDLNTRNVGQVKYLRDTVNRRFVVTYDTIMFYGGTYPVGKLSLQCIVNYGDSTVTYQYKDLSLTNGAHTDVTIGTENGAGTTGLQYYYNATALAGLGNYPWEGLAVKFYPDLKADDIAALNILNPTSSATLVQGFPITVKGNFTNPGLLTQTFDGIMTIKNGATVVYADTVYSLSLAMNVTDTVTFDPFIAATAGVDTFILSVNNPGDEVPSNNVFSVTRTINQHFGAGGPDARKYKWIDSAVPGGPTFSWIELNPDSGGTGTALSTTGADDAAYPFHFGFSFPFYGASYDSAWATTNGLITFGSSSTEWTNAIIPSTGLPNNFIAPFWDDTYFNYANGSRFLYKNFGTYTVVEWFHFSITSSGATTISYEVILYNDGTVVTQYKNVGGSTNYLGESATVGIENGTGTIGLQYEYNGSPIGNLLFNNAAIKFYVWQPDTDAVAISNQRPATQLVGTAVAPAVTVKNNGIANLSFNIRQVITGPYPATTVVSDITEATPVITSGTTLPYTFTSTWTPAAIGKYTIYDSVLVAGEQWPGDNQITATSYVINSTTMPLHYDFEANDGGFAGFGDWQWGVPRYATGPDSSLIPSPYNLWGTNLTGNYTNGQLNMLYFPAVALTGGDNFKLTFNKWHKFEAAAYDGANLKISTDNGATWAVLTTSAPYTGTVTDATNPMNGQQVWGGNDTLWTQVIMDLSPYVGQTIMLRLDQGSNSSTNYAGMYIDNVDLVIIQADVGVASIDQPPAGSVMASGSYTVQTTLQNYTPRNSFFDVYLEFDGVKVDSMMGFYLAGSTNQQVTWPTPWVVTAGSHTVRAYTVLDIDANSGNDSKSRTYNVINKVPGTYTQNFDGTRLVVPPEGWQVINNLGSSNWVNYAYTTDSTKVHSRPNDAYVAYTSGTHDLWLVSPPIDLSTVAGAKLQFFEAGSWWSTSYVCRHNVMIVRGNIFGTDTVTIADWNPTNHTIPSSMIGASPVELGLTQFNNQTIWIVFRYQSGSSADNWWVDDVSLIPLPAHDVSVAGITSPIISPIQNGGTYDLVASVLNTGANAETFDVTAIDDHGFSNTQTVTSLAAFGATNVTFPGWAIGTGCDPYNVTITATLATDTVPGNNVLATRFVPVDPGNNSQVFDTGIPANAWRYLSPRDIIANRFDTDASNGTISSIAFKLTNKDAYPTWPDANRDSVVAYIFVDGNNDGLPDATPLFSEHILAQTYGWTVWQVGCHTTLPVNCQSFWAGWSQLDSLKPEGILVDAATDNPTKKWVRSSGVWSQYSGTTVGDNFIRAYFTTEAPTPAAIALGENPLTGDAIRTHVDTLTTTIANVGLGCDLRYSVADVIQSFSTMMNEIASVPAPRPMPGEASTIENRDEIPVQMVTLSGDKGTVTEPQYPPMILGSGGPDAGGYRWIDSDATGGPTYSWVDISTVGTNVTFNGTNDDSYTANPIAMGMSFTFYGGNYSNVYVSTNGFISFLSLSTSYAGNTTIPNSSAPNAAIYPEWDDLNGNHTGSRAVYYHDVVNNRFIISWLAWDYYYSPYSQHDFQVILNGNDNSIILQYGTSTAGYQALSTVGIENDAGTIATQIAYNQTYLHNNLAIKLYKPTVWLSTDLGNGVISTIDPPRPFRVFASATQLPVGSYSGGVVIGTNDPAIPRDTLRVNFTVNSVIIGVAPSAVAHTQEYGTETDYLSDFSVSNTGTTDLIYTAVNTKPWITVSSPTGSIAPGGAQPFDIHVNTAGLAAGVYTDTVTFTSNDPYNPVVRLPRITITVTAPNIGFTPASIAKTQETDVSMTYTAAFRINNAGTSALNWNATNTLPWLTLGATTGSVPAASNQPVDITVNTAGITPGTYTDEIQVTSNDPDEPVKSLPVTITVSLIGVNPGDINVTMIQNTSQIVGLTVGNGTAVPVRIDMAATPVEWLSVAPAIDTIPAHGNVPVQVTINAPSTVGEYDGSVTITSSNLATGLVTVPVHLTVVTPAAISLAPLTLDHVQESGSTVTYTSDFAISNEGGWPLSWNATNNLSWLVLSNTTGTIAPAGNTPIDVTISTAGLAPGDYLDVITITSNDPVAPSVELPVNIIVSQVAPSVDHFDINVIAGEQTQVTFDIGNGSAVAVHVALVATPPAWLSVAPPEADIPAHGSVTIQVNVDATGLTEGAYTGLITISSSNMTAALIEIPVGLTVNPAGPQCRYFVGDVNHRGRFTGLDVVYGVAFLKGGPAPEYSCECTPGHTWFVEGDVNASCTFTGLDITYMVDFLKGRNTELHPCPSCPPVGDPYIAGGTPQVIQQGNSH